jgi:hypothetical protein
MNVITVKEYYDLLKIVKAPLVVMGTPGISKTSIPAQVAKDFNDGSKSVVIPVAQFSETGDILGCPDIVEVMEKDEHGNEVKMSKTVYSPPDYWPTHGKGYLVIDDFNRANTLIGQSLLHLAQYREFGNYQVPPLVFDDKGKWISGFKLVFTGNTADAGDEEGTEYIVNEVDDAFFSRTICYKLQFDKIMWGRWARTNGIDEKYVSFILKNPQMITAKDNPRAWSNGFLELGNTPDMKYIEMIMSGVVDGYVLLTSWLEKEWTSLNFDSLDVFDKKKHNNLMKIFKETGPDGKNLFAERIATLPVKDIDKKKQESLREFFHLMKKEDEERFMLAFIPVNKECPSMTDDELFSSLV